MVTPMTPDGAVDTKGVAATVEHLISLGHDGVVVNGTTGESPTLSAAESIAMVHAVKDAAGDPQVHVTGSVATAAALRGIHSWHLSLSHDGDMAVAMVVAERA